MKKILFTFIFGLMVLTAGFCQTKPEKWNEFKSTHFIISYKNSPEEFIQRLANSAEGYYDSIADSLGFRRFNFWLWDNRAKIYIYDDAKDYYRSTGQPEWSAGAAMPQQKIINSFTGAENFFEDVLPHEMGHIIFRELVGFNNQAVPLWLEEGVASYQQRFKFPQELVVQAIKSGKFIPIQELSLPAQTNKQQAQIFYAEAVSIVDFLIHESGADTFTLFCQYLRDKKDLDKALASVYPYANLKELDEAWQKHLNIP